MDLKTVQTELRRLSALAEGWRRPQDMTAIERDLVLARLRDLYEAVSFGFDAAAESPLPEVTRMPEDAGAAVSDPQAAGAVSPVAASAAAGKEPGTSVEASAEMQADALPAGRPAGAKSVEEPATEPIPESASAEKPAEESAGEPADEPVTLDADAFLSLDGLLRQPVAALREEPRSGLASERAVTAPASEASEAPAAASSASSRASHAVSAFRSLFDDESELVRHRRKQQVIMSLYDTVPEPATKRAKAYADVPESAAPSGVFRSSRSIGGEVIEVSEASLSAELPVVGMPAVEALAAKVGAAAAKAAKAAEAAEAPEIAETPEVPEPAEAIESAASQEEAEAADMPAAAASVEDTPVPEETAAPERAESVPEAPFAEPSDEEPAVESAVEVTAEEPAEADSAESAAESRAEAVAENSVEAAPEEACEEDPETIMDDAPEEVIGNASDDVLGNAREELPGDIFEDTSENTVERASGEAPEEAAANAPEASADPVTEPQPFAAPAEPQPFAAPAASPAAPASPAAGTVLGEVIAPHVQTLADTLAASASDDVAADLRRREPVTDLRRAVGINDKFLLIRDLFDGNGSLYEITIRRLNEFDNFDDCMIYIAEHFAWNPNSDGAKLMMDLLERKFA